MAEIIKLSDIFPGEPPVYEIKRERRTVSGEVPLLCAEIEYPVFAAADERSAGRAAGHKAGREAGNEAGLERINEFYAGLAVRFFDWASSGGRERAEAVYSADADPQKRFRFLRFRCHASFLPGFCSPGLISVAGSAVLYRARQPVGGCLLSRLFRASDGRLLPQRPPRTPREDDFYLSREGELVFREIREGKITDLPDGSDKADKLLSKLKTISEFF